MIKRLDPVDRARMDLVKIIRSIIRLKHSLAADDEINQVLPRTVIRFNAQILRGKLPKKLALERFLNG